MHSDIKPTGSDSMSFYLYLNKTVNAACLRVCVGACACELNFSSYCQNRNQWSRMPYTFIVNKVTSAIDHK